MLHEIILALNGCLSSVVHENFEAVELSKILHPSEKALLKRILQIGETYGNIVIFIDKNICPTIDLDILDTGNDESNVMENGMYLQAFCDGLQKVLRPYRSDIVKLEKLALKDPYLSLTSINSYIGGYIQLIYTLYSMITEIKEDRIHGCKLLHFVCRHLCTGVESMRDALSEIANSCHVVLINQLTNWLLCGQLLDRYNEFFIRPNIAMAIGANGSTVSNENENVVDDPNVNLSSVEIQNDGNEFFLDTDFLPPYISFVTANKILYIGKTVVLLKSNLQKGKSGRSSHIDVYNQEDLKLIKSLRFCSFQDCQSLESVIVDLESSVAKRLWFLAVEQADLMGQLKAMKEFYLLGRGEMFVDFLRKIGSTLNKHISSNITRDLNIALLASARNIQYPFESTLEKFVFSLPPKESSNQAKVKLVLRLEYSATLPLHLFFSPIVIDNYNVLFRFFLRVKQAQLNLHAVWLKGVKNKTQLLTDRSWQLRNHLMFLVENLQCYLQWDVVESEHTALLTEIKKIQDFEKIRHLHHNFLYNVLSQAFLIPNDAKLDQNTGLLLTSAVPQNMKPHAANVFLGHILDLSETFCLLVTKRDNVDISDELEMMSEKLSHCVKVLVKLITNLRNQLSGVHLTKLLLRLDYNHYFSLSQAAAAALISSSTT